MSSRAINGQLSEQPAGSKQRGAVLVVALLMLLVLTGLGVATINSTNINLQLVQSQQRQRETEQVAENAINYLLSDMGHFVNNSDYLDGEKFHTDISQPGQCGNSITVNSLQCLLQAAPVVARWLGKFALCPDYYWEANVSVTDSTSGASSTFVEGFKFRYLAGYCPA